MPSDYPLWAKQVVDRLITLVSVPCALKKVSDRTSVTPFLTF
jgi:hypothetical protein